MERYNQVLDHIAHSSSKSTEGKECLHKRHVSLIVAGFLINSHRLGDSRGSVLSPLSYLTPGDDNACGPAITRNRQRGNRTIEFVARLLANALKRGRRHLLEIRLIPTNGLTPPQRDNTLAAILWRASLLLLGMNWPEGTSPARLLAEVLTWTRRDSRSLAIAGPELTVGWRPLPFQGN